MMEGGRPGRMAAITSSGLATSPDAPTLSMAAFPLVADDWLLRPMILVRGAVAGGNPEHNWCNEEGLIDARSGG